MSSNASVPDLETGRSIYQHGIGRDAIGVEIFGERVENAATFTCAACHGEYGAGGSEGGIVAPSLIVDEQMSGETLEAWLGSALDLGGSPASERTSGGKVERMPRFRMSARDRSALASYIRTLPNPPVTGLTNDTLVVGLETTGTGLDEAGRAALMHEISGLFGKLAGYGLLGRRIEVRDVTGQGPRAEVFAAILWDPRAAIEAPLRMSIRPPVGTGEQGLCASVQPSLAEQYEMLTLYLDRRKVRYWTIWSGAEPPFELPLSATPQDAQGSDDMVEIRLDPGHDLSGAKPTYVFADQVGASASNVQSPGLHLLVPARISEQERAAKDILSRNPVDPRSAGAIAMIRNAAQALFTTLARSGRRISVRAACEDLAKASRRLYHLDDIHAGNIVAIDP
ncbi:cytochrome c [Novosphingobium profundi]|uniref:c-type cytochrome n=1 Tax=Novosphingobium profundi TaxID=1774954 RepID=UPI001BDA8C35|nr:cytochrome c [Novosphingobium profundi]MBT0670106.1 cytochrome c [Novosphingobium profundi]